MLGSIIYAYPQLYGGGLYVMACQNSSFGFHNTFRLADICWSNSYSNGFPQTVDKVGDYSTLCYSRLLALRTFWFVGMSVCGVANDS